jgi:hypothetical protein
MDEHAPKNKNDRSNTVVLIAKVAFYLLNIKQK